MKKCITPDALHGAVKRREQAAPYTKVAAENGSACLYGRNGAYATLAVGRVPLQTLVPQKRHRG